MTAHFFATALRTAAAAPAAAAMLTVLLSAAGAARAQCYAPQQELLASDGTTSDELGRSLAVSGAAALVGAWRDDHVASLCGSAYVYRFEGDGWALEQKLLPPDGRSADFFGWAVDLDGDTAVIGAVSDDDGAENAGAVYVYRFDGAHWQFEAELHSADVAAGDQFGGAVAIQGNTLLVGADDDDDNGTDSGSAYVFRRENGVWSERQKLHPSTPSSFEHFGFAVDLYGDVAVVGAYAGPTQIFRGTAYVYRFDGASWQEEARLWGSQSVSGDFFAASVAVAGNTILCGARWADIGVLDCGEAYLFRNDGEGWVERQRLAEPAPGGSDGFGFNVALSDGVALVGVPNRDRPQGARFGHVRLYRDTGAGWVSEPPLVAGDGAAEDRFGDGIALSRSFALLGATWHDHRADNAGAAYVFDVAACAPDLPGDLDGDGDVDLTDLSLLLAAFGSCLGDPDFDPNADLDNTLCVDLTDLSILLANFGL